MAKLDDLVMILEEEVHSFSSSVAELKSFIKEFQKPEIQSELFRIRNLLEEKNRFQTERLADELRELKKLKQKLQKAQVIPKWLLVLYGVLLGGMFIFLIIRVILPRYL